MTQLLLANERFPGVNLSARFPYHPRLVQPCPQLDLFEKVENDNVCFVNCTNFNYLIGALGSGIENFMVKRTSAFLHNSVLTPRLLLPHTYKICPMGEVNLTSVPHRGWQRWLIVFHSKHAGKKHRVVSLSISFTRKKLKDYTELQWEIGANREEMEKKYDELECCCKQFYQIRLSGELMFRIKCDNAHHKAHKDPLYEMMRQEHFSNIIAESVRSLCPDASEASAEELGLGNLFCKEIRSSHSTSAGQLSRKKTQR